MTFGQAMALGAAVAVATVLAVFDLMLMYSAAILFLATVFGLIIFQRLCATILALLAKPSEPPVRTPDDELEVLTVLIPIYREASDVVVALIKALEALEYPADKLDVKLLLEADDPETIDSVMQAGVPSRFELLPVPPGNPRTKPKALNYGLESARGTVVAVYDAEDRPSPAQPREAVATFLRGPPDLAVVQAPLLVHNGGESWVARHFEVEYAILFRVWLPFLARLGLPLPLGGTSNYFRTDRLKAAGGWDAWNVTEDADLGLRLARFGGKAATISSPTWEEAPVHFRDWLAQRTRWTKGHLQTWLVLMRRPITAATQMGWLNFASVQLTLGGSLLTSAMHTPLLVWLMFGLFTPLVSLEGWHAALCGIGYGGVIAAAVAARLKYLPAKTLLSLPLYWPLLSFAMLRALLQMISRPYFWAKTPHGLQARIPTQAR